eukprot:5574414-Prymnesium_polylepis.5
MRTSHQAGRQWRRRAWPKMQKLQQPRARSWPKKALDRRTEEQEEVSSPARAETGDAAAALDTVTEAAEAPDPPAGA